LKYSGKLKNIFSNDCQIIGKEKYLNSAVLIPIISTSEGESVLFEKRSINVRQPGEISFPGGHFDRDKDKEFKSTALRETSEELGIGIDKIEYIGKLGSLIAPMGVLVEAFVGFLKIDSIDELKIDRKEVESIFLLPVEYFVNNNPEEYNTKLELHPYIISETGEKQELLPVKDLGLPERYGNKWTNGKHRVLVYRTEKEVIWGITAELIYEFSKRLREAVG
jgi:coenzyme A diphosphatase NUDT7